MNVEFSLVDKQTGEVMVTGIATHYSYTYDNYGQKKVHIEGVTLSPVKHHTPRNPNYIPDQLDACRHKWKDYQGLSETYEVCDMCGVKK